MAAPMPRLHVIEISVVSPYRFFLVVLQSSGLVKHFTPPTLSGFML
jgi:hypothetical protein